MDMTLRPRALSHSARLLRGTFRGGLSLSLALAVSILTVAAPRPASAFCGFYVSGAEGDVFNDATQVVLMRFGTLTVLSMQNAYKGPPENFAMVVPVPVVLQEENVKTLEPAVFSVVDKLAAPRLVEYWEQNPCPQPVNYSSDMKRSRAAEPMGAMADEDRGGADLGVKVEAQFKVGEYEVVILSAKDSTGLDTWLKREKYDIPDGAEPFLRPYVESGSKFFVAKVDVSKIQFEDGRALLSPLRFHYESEVFSLPIRLGMMNSSGTQDLIVHVLAPNQRYEVANYTNVTIPTNLVVEDDVRKDFGGFYNALFDYTVEQNPGAIVTEYSWPSWPGKCDPCPGAVQGIDMNTLQMLGADTIGMVISKIDLVAMQDQLQKLQQTYYESSRTGKVDPDLTREMQEVSQRYYTAQNSVQTVMNSFVLTRLHARYEKGTVGDDLVFRAAPPIIGGRGMPGPKGELEERTQPSSTNQFQGRYAILHRWTGGADCPNPQFGRWGGPPKGGGMQIASPPPSAELAIATRGDVDLQKLVGGTLPEFEYRTNAEAQNSLPSRGRGDRGCGCQASSTAPAGLALFAIALLGLRRRRSWSASG